MDIKHVLMTSLLLFLLIGCSRAEVQQVRLAAEQNAALELTKSCTQMVAGAANLCSGQQPYIVHADTSTGCKKYYRCLPGHGACMYSCPQGQLFNAACACCQDASLVQLDLHTCSSVSSSSSTGSSTHGMTLRSSRLLLSATAEPGSQAHTITPPVTQDDDSITFNAATRTATSTSTGQVVQLPLRSRPLPAGGAAAAWGFNAYGKRYSSGPWAARDAVKEPALAVNRQPAPSHPPAATSDGSTTSSSSSNTGIAAGRKSTIVNEIGSRTSTRRLPVSAEDKRRRTLMQVLQQQSLVPGSARLLAMKRVQRLQLQRQQQQQQASSVAGGAAGVSAGQLDAVQAYALSEADNLLALDATAAAALAGSSSSALLSPSLVTAAKSVDPADEAGAFAAAGGAARD